MSAHPRGRAIMHNHATALGLAGVDESSWNSSCARSRRSGRSGGLWSPPDIGNQMECSVPLARVCPLRRVATRQSAWPPCRSGGRLIAYSGKHGDPMVAVAGWSTLGRSTCAKDPGRTCTVWRPAWDSSSDGLAGHTRVAAGQGLVVSSPANSSVLISLCCPSARAGRRACCSLAGQRPRFVRGPLTRGNLTPGRGRRRAGTRGQGGQKPGAAVTR